MKHIEIDGTKLMHQAGKTANDYLLDALASIDKHLGKGYASEHPELIAGFMQTAAIDMGSAVLAKILSESMQSFGSGTDVLIEFRDKLDALGPT